MRGGGGGHLGLRLSSATVRTGAWVAAMACCGLPAWAQAPLATRGGWEAGVQLSDYRYEEPGTMTLEGARFGTSGAYTAVTPRRAFARFEGRWSYGELEYQGSGVMTGVPDHIFEIRLLAGRDYAARVLEEWHDGAPSPAPRRQAPPRLKKAAPAEDDNQPPLV